MIGVGGIRERERWEGWKWGNDSLMRASMRGGEEVWERCFVFELVLGFVRLGGVAREFWCLGGLEEIGW